MEWRSVQRKEQGQLYLLTLPAAGKIILTLFWDIECVILVHFTPKGETVNN
jgi:hypothetical protein